MNADLYFYSHNICSHVSISCSSKQDTRLFFPSPHSITVLKQWDSDSPSSRYMPKEFVLNSKGQKHLFESVKEGWSVGLERGKWVMVLPLFLFSPKHESYIMLFSETHAKARLLPSEFTPECITWWNKYNIKQQIYLYCLSQRFLRENGQLLFNPYCYFLFFFYILKIFKKIHLRSKKPR